jgi:hypothetical protein
MLYVIRRNDERYPGMAGTDHPPSLAVEGTLDQAEWVARELSLHFAGC